MAKSRRVRSESQTKYKIITLGCSSTCIALNLSIAYLYYFHPYAEVFDNEVSNWATYPNLAFVVVLIFLTLAIYRHREPQSLKWVFVVLCTLLFLEILIACAGIIAYVIRSDQKLSILKVDGKIQKEFKCRFIESKNSTTRPECILTLKRYIRNRAVSLTTIYITKFVLLGSEALMILFHYMKYLPA